MLQTDVAGSLGLNEAQAHTRIFVFVACVSLCLQLHVCMLSGTCVYVHIRVPCTRALSLCVCVFVCGLIHASRMYDDAYTYIYTPPLPEN